MGAAPDRQVGQTTGMAAVTADRTAGITAGLDQLPTALASLRRRQLTLADGLSPEQLAGPSRCHRWTAHEVLRHVRDACRLHVTGLQGAPIRSFDQPFDSRMTPDEWLSLSTGQNPEQTVGELQQWCADESLALPARLAAGDQDIMAGPYGPLPWTLLSLHVLWDGWLHDRDVALVTGGGHPSTPAEDALVATYALFITSMVAVLMGAHVDLTVSLTSDDAHYLAAVGPGHIELHTVDRAHADAAPAPAAADFHGRLDAVVDSLAGRGPALADVLAGDPIKREPLTWVGARLAPAPAT